MNPDIKGIISDMDGVIASAGIQRHAKGIRYH